MLLGAVPQVALLLQVNGGAEQVEALQLCIQLRPNDKSRRFVDKRIDADHSETDLTEGAVGPAQVRVNDLVLPLQVLSFLLRVLVHIGLVVFGILVLLLLLLLLLGVKLGLTWSFGTVVGVGAGSYW